LTEAKRAASEAKKAATDAAKRAAAAAKDRRAGSDGSGGKGDMHAGFTAFVQAAVKSSKDGEPANG